MIIIGITGSSGSGKTTVSEILNRRSDFRVIDADKCAKEMAKPNSPYLNEIAEKIGNEVILEDGNLNRKLLADYIYHEDEKRAILNNITKKHIDNELKNKIKEIENEAGVKYIIIDAPLLFEMNFEFLCNYTIALIANEALKIDRICKRDKGEKNMVSENVIKSEIGLRKLIQRNLEKDIHPGTKPSIDFIYKISHNKNYDNC